MLDSHLGRKRENRARLPAIRWWHCGLVRRKFAVLHHCVRQAAALAAPQIPIRTAIALVHRIEPALIQAHRLTVVSLDLLQILEILEATVPYAGKTEAAPD